MFSKQDIKQTLELLSTSKHIIITSHKSPDGDSVGSSLSLFYFLKNMGVSSTICHPDKMSSYLKWLNGTESILTFDENESDVKSKFEVADLIFCLDYNHPSRIGKMQELLVNSDAKKIMIDHHQDPNTDFVDILFSDSNNSSTSQMIYELIEELGETGLIDENVGTPMYCGIMTDTGSFRFPSTTAKTHLIIASLIEKGIKNAKVHENTFDTNSISKLKLNGYAIANKLVILPNSNVGYISLSQKELTDFGYTKGDTEGLVNVVLGITGIKMAAFFKEDSGYVKISFRSKGDTFVNVLSNENFSGGGHVYAAGGKFDGKLEDAVEKFVTVANNYVS